MMLPSVWILPLWGLEWSFEMLEADPENSMELSQYNEAWNWELAEKSFDILTDKDTSIQWSTKSMTEEEEKEILI